jgi:hypothetical protein
VNIVNLIKDQLTGDVLGKLGAAIGESEEKTRSAANAAVPSLLSALANLAAGGQGAEKLIDVLRHFDDDSINKLRADVAQGGSEVRDKGADILGSLLGGNLPALLNILARFSGVGASALKGLLSYLAPLILSVIAAQLKGKGLSPASLGSFFAEQKGNINAALPAGFSLADVPSAPRAPEAGVPAWLLPLAALVLLGIAAWYFLGNQAAEAPQGEAPPAANAGPVPTQPGLEKPKAEEVEIPTAEEVTKSLDGVYETATTQLESVKDEATAEAAKPTLTGLAAHIDAAKLLFDKLPQEAKDAAKKTASEKLDTFKALVDKTVELPGVGAKLKALLDSLIAKLTAFTA